MSELSEGVATVMFLRDGWPRINVCKVQMRDGRVGVGVYIPHGEVSAEHFDRMAQIDAMQHISEGLPDYSSLHDYVAKVRALSANGASNG